MDIEVNSTGILRYGDLEFRCALGRGGIKEDKVEGDGATPVGRFKLRYILYRLDKVIRPISVLPMDQIAKDDGWCDDPEDPKYNKPVKLPYEASTEHLFRTEDDVYDVIVVIGHNDHPPKPYKGSAVFMHVARDGYTPTEGCVALEKTDLLKLLAAIKPDTYIKISL